MLHKSTGSLYSESFVALNQYSNTSWLDDFYVYFQAAIIFADIDGTKVNKLIHNVKGIANTEIRLYFAVIHHQAYISEHAFDCITSSSNVLCAK